MEPLSERGRRWGCGAAALNDGEEAETAAVEEKEDKEVDLPRECGLSEMGARSGECGCPGRWGLSFALGKSLPRAFGRANEPLDSGRDGP